MILTNWGYALMEVETLPDMLTEEEFNTMTAGKFKGDVRIASELKAAQGAIRDYVGWHLAGNLVCECSMIALAKNISQVGNDMLIQLPARYVTEVSEVLVDGNSVPNYDIQTNGVLRLFDVAPSVRYSKIITRYKAGLTDEISDVVKELIAHRITHALASSYGVQSETTGGMSVTYNASWINNSRATALPVDNKEVLMPYRLQGVF